jgi:hypothetical protein
VSKRFLTVSNVPSVGTKMRTPFFWMSHTSLLVSLSVAKVYLFFFLTSV